MSSHKKTLSPIISFLGNTAGNGGPFALLGLPHDIQSDDQVYLATNRCLDRVDRHRHRSTPDADEVRLAIHSAASQLLDHALRQELLLRWPEGKPAELPRAWQSRPNANQLSEKIIHKAKCLVAASGGWNNTARKRIAYLARIQRVPAQELVGALRPQLQRQSDSKRALPLNQRKPQADRVPIEDSPPSGVFIWTSIYVCLLILGVSIALTVVATRSRIALYSTLTDRVAQVEDDSKVNAELTDEESPVSRVSFEHYTAIAHELDQLVINLQSDLQGSIEQFVLLYPVFIESWMQFPPQALNRSGAHILEIIKRAEAFGDSENQFITIIHEQLKQVSPNSPDKQIIQSSIVSSLLSSNVLSPQVNAELRKSHRSAIGIDPVSAESTFKSLVPIAGLIGVHSNTDSVQWWSLWTKGLIASTKNDSHQRDRIILSILSSRLQDNSQPSDQWDLTARALVNLLDWREGSSERYWLFRQFVDDRVSTQRLAALTEAIAIHSAAPNVNAQMVLNPSSTNIQRQQMQRLYRQAWEPRYNESSASLEVGVNALANELHVQVSLTPSVADENTAVETIVALAKLNSVAWASEKGEGLLEEFSSSSLKKGKPQAMSGLDKTPVGEQWAFDAMNAKDTQSLSNLFAHLVQAGGPDIYAAYALVYLATTSNQPEFRVLSSAQLVRYQDYPSVLIALDHAIGGKRITSRLAQLISKIVPGELPDRTDQLYFIEAHRHLTLLLIDSLAESIDSPLRLLESDLSILYHQRLFLNTGSQAENLRAVDSAKLIYRQQLSKTQEVLSGSVANTKSVSIAMNRFAVRLKRSNNSISLFLAYQRGIAELLAIEVGVNHPSEQLQISGVLNELAERLELSQSILEQIMQTERSIAQLWIIRLEARPV